MNFKTRLAQWNQGIGRGAQRLFARKLKVSEVLVSDWSRGRRPSEVQTRKIAAEFHITVPEVLALFEDRAFPPGVDMSSLVRDVAGVPVLGRVAADRFAVSFTAPPEEVIPSPDSSRTLFALRISGDCMEPTFRDGEYVYLSADAEPVNGKVVLAQLDGEFTLKRYFKRADGVELRPDNKKYKPLKLTTSHLIIKGVVVGTYRRDI